MGRLTEVFDVIQNGFDEPEKYHWIEPRDEDTRGILKKMRKIAKKVRNQHARKLYLDKDLGIESY